VTTTQARSTWQGKLDADVFIAGIERYTWRDVVLAAMLSGEWAELAEQVREVLAGLGQLAAAGRTLDPDEVTAEANEFRYARELLTAEETEAWLAGWGLTADQWMEYIERSVLRRRCRSGPEQQAARCRVSADDLADRVWVEAVCSGTLERLARELAGRAAAAVSLDEPSPIGEGTDRLDCDAAVDGVLAEAAGQGLGSLLAVEQCRVRLAHLRELRRRFEHFRRRVVTPTAVRSSIQAHGLDWIRVRCQSVSFSDEQVALEAACCVREDGQTLDEVARMARVTISERWLGLDETDLPERQTFLSTKPESLLGPLLRGGEYALVRVVEKVLPSFDDPAIQAHAEGAVLRAAVEREVATRVRWHARP